MSEAKPEARRCRAERVTYRIGRNVAETVQCKARTKHPSGLCHRHRSDADHPDYTPDA